MDANSDENRHIKQEVVLLGEFDENITIQETTVDEGRAAHTCGNHVVNKAVSESFAPAVGGGSAMEGAVSSGAIAYPARTAYRRRSNAGVEQSFAGPQLVNDDALRYASYCTILAISNHS